MSLEVLGPYMVCCDCLLYIANGDLPEGRRAAERIENADQENWTIGDSANDDEFSWSACDRCDSALGGSRHEAFILQDKGV